MRTETMHETKTIGKTTVGIEKHELKQKTNADID